MNWFSFLLRWRRSLAGFVVPFALFRHFSLSFSSSTSSSTPSESANTSSLYARLIFIFEQIDQIEKERSEKDDALQCIRAWRKSKKLKQEEKSDSKDIDDRQSSTDTRVSKYGFFYPAPEPFSFHSCFPSLAIVRRRQFLTPKQHPAGTLRLKPINTPRLNLLKTARISSSYSSGANLIAILPFVSFKSTMYAMMMMMFG